MVEAICTAGDFPNNDSLFSCQKIIIAIKIIMKKCLERPKQITGFFIKLRLFGDTFVKDKLFKLEFFFQDFLIVSGKFQQLNFFIV